jgi:arginase
MSKRVGFLGVPMDLGGGLRGVYMGPSAIRIAGLGKRVQALGLEFEDLGNVPVLRPEAKEPKDTRARYLDPISNCCRRLRGRVERLSRKAASRSSSAATTRSRAARWRASRASITARRRRSA